ncbi:MAG TPA: endonuclease/exonuclease/phosphatase family protein, partial [Phototrophicaceae bacterium]|nr:endonuclease/exonuclease/phosphatase family protein [Phototrophicaceae bacterium]
MAALIRDTGADVVALQEVSAAAADYFNQNLKDLYLYRAFHSSADEPVIGQGILSRYPILNDDYWRNNQLPVRLGHQRVQLQIQGQTVNLYNTHPIHPIFKAGQIFNVDLRTTEIQSVLDRANQDIGAVIIVGDFNMADQSDDYQHITSQYADTFREVGWWMGFTFPDFLSPNAAPGGKFALPVRPVVRLDYIFHNDALLPVQAQVWRTSGGSDHRPVLAT